MWAAVETTGYPAIIKPISGAGSADTYKVADARELERVLPRMGHVHEAICEEFIDGEEHTYDSVCIDGQPVYENVIRYIPNAIEMRSLEWVSPIMLSVRDLSGDRVAGGVALGRRVLTALGMNDGMTHMEWFRTSSGEAVFGEIACRAGGAMVVDMMNYTSDIDLFREWARVVTARRFEAARERKYAVGVIFKRAQGQGRISAIVGLDAFLARHGAHVVEERLLRPGTPRRDWKSTLLSDGHIVVRHPDDDEAARISSAAARDIQMFAS